MHTSQVPQEHQVKKSTFDTIFKEIKTVRTSGREHGACDRCLRERERLRGLPDDQLDDIVTALATHLRFASEARALYNLRRKARTLNTAMISFDYSKLVMLPSLVQSGMEDYFAQMHGYNVQVFGIVNDYEGDTGTQYNYLQTEGTGHGANHVISMLNHFLNTHSDVGQAKTLYLQSDSCTSQNKNNIVLAYFAHRVALRLNERIVWSFMEVGHTHGHVDAGFGWVRSSLKRRHSAWGLPSLCKAIEQSTNEGHLHAVSFPAESFRDFKTLADAKYYDFFDIRKTFVYEWEITGNREGNSWVVYARARRTPTGDYDSTGTGRGATS